MTAELKRPGELDWWLAHIRPEIGIYIRELEIIVRAHQENMGAAEASRKQQDALVAQRDQLLEALGIIRKALSEGEDESYFPAYDFLDKANVDRTQLAQPKHPLLYDSVLIAVADVAIKDK